MKSKLIRADLGFCKTMEDFMAKFEKVVGVKISTVEATKIIDSKIKDAGGLAV